VLNRFDRESFFKRFEEEHAVQYFYEPFLKAYDPELRKELGVWYTPPEIVQYQVERVDRVLREELDVADGLADDRVVILDPCCGTGAYLVETLKRIHRTLKEKGNSALTAQRLKRAAMERVFGFEILPAPFVVSHLQIGLMLRLLGVPLDPDSNERAGVYLTNALTGWEPTKEPKDKIPGILYELMEERDAANKVKRDVPILVILGNPPYNAFAGTSPKEEGGLVEPYKEGLTTPVEKGGWGIKKFNLDDLFVRFFRIAERRIVKSGKGVVSYISNYSWTSEPSFVVLRKRLLESFDKFWVENMHGNRKISEYAPDGRTSETVFAIPGSSPGIQQGVVVSLWVRCEGHKDKPGKFGKVLYRDDLDAAKAVERRQQLLDSLRLKQFDRKYKAARPGKINRYSFRPLSVSDEYVQWPKLLDLPGTPPICGYKENRGFSMIQDEKERLRDLMKKYYNPKVTWQELEALGTGITRDSAGYAAAKMRVSVLKSERFCEEAIQRYTLRPFDTKWAYYSSVPSFWNRARPSLYQDHFENNAYFVMRSVCVASPEGTPFFFTSCLGDFHHVRGQAHHFPIRLRRPQEKPKDHDIQNNFVTQVPAEPTITANLSETSRAYLKELGIGDPDKDAKTAGLIWMHALAIGYSPAYLSENADGIHQDWPRIPLPKTKKALMKSAELGRRVAELLDTERPVDGVTQGAIRRQLVSIAVVRKVGGGSLNLKAAELDMTAGWGHGGKGGVCMPGKGKCVVRSQKQEHLKKAFGENTLDVYLNDVGYWENVPESVWDYTIGGYQVIKKWLSYREKAMLGRALSMDEVEYVTEMARRIAGLILLQPELDANYAGVKEDTWAWKRS
jgi:predicted helicase